MIKNIENQKLSIYNVDPKYKRISKEGLHCFTGDRIKLEGFLVHSENNSYEKTN